MEKQRKVVPIREESDAVIKNSHPVVGFYRQNVQIHRGCKSCGGDVDKTTLQLGILCTDGIMDVICDSCARRLELKLYLAREALFPTLEYGDWDDETQPQKLQAHGLVLLEDSLIVLAEDAAKAAGYLLRDEIEVKWNILANHEWCALCNRNVCIDFGPWPFVRGTVRPVCVECAAERGVREPFECGRDEKPTEENKV